MVTLREGLEMLGRGAETLGTSKRLKTATEAVMEEPEESFVGGIRGRKSAAALTSLGQAGAAQSLRRRQPESISDFAGQLLMQFKDNPNDPKLSEALNALKKVSSMIYGSGHYSTNSATKLEVLGLLKKKAGGESLTDEEELLARTYGTDEAIEYAGLSSINAPELFKNISLGVDKKYRPGLTLSYQSEVENNKKILENWNEEYRKRVSDVEQKKGQSLVGIQGREELKHPFGRDTPEVAAAKKIGANLQQYLGRAAPPTAKQAGRVSESGSILESPDEVMNDLRNLGLFK